MSNDPRLDDLDEKQKVEARFWDQFVWRTIDWYEGKIPELFGQPLPKAELKETRYSLRENAIRTWINASRNRYFNSLQVNEDSFIDCRVLDIGCGPLPNLKWFNGADRYGIDHLISVYKYIGFPLENYDPPITYFDAPAEKIPVEDNFFDIVISVNAIDHVDDFGAVAKEIARVLKPTGKLRLHAHYHQATNAEPCELNDDIMMQHYGSLGISKIYERAHPRVPEEKETLWAN